MNTHSLDLEFGEPARVMGHPKRLGIAIREQIVPADLGQYDGHPLAIEVRSIGAEDETRCSEPDDPYLPKGSAAGA
jgi:hypothetical protein